MKSILLVLPVLFIFNLWGGAQSATDQIIEAEKKAYMHLHKSTRETAADCNVTSVRLELWGAPAVKYLTGKVTTGFAFYNASSSIEFDLTDSLNVDSVYYHNAGLSFGHSNNVIHIDLPAAIPAGQLDSITVFYQGVPSGGQGFGSFVQGMHADTVPVIWTLSEPYGAKDWWPCKQNLSDKIDSLDVIVTTPNGNRAASNGLLVEEIQSGGNTLYHWKHRYPIAAYLVCFAVSNYVVYSDYVPFNGDTLQVLNYVYPEHLTDAQTGTAAIVHIMQLYDTLFGVYPFSAEKYGMTEFGWGGGMEHQTMTFVTNFGFELIAHELAHHWFGDKITCSSWQDIWLNEGFATYSSGICYEHIAPEWWRHFLEIRQSSAVEDDHGSVWCDDTTSVGRIFRGNLTYNKGSAVLHSLRYILGDSIFFTALRSYLADVTLAYSFATTGDLRQHCEAASGRNLSLFFNQWVYGKGYPSYTINWSQDFANRVTLKIHQTQSDPSISYFEMPLPLRFAHAGADTIIIVQNDINDQTYSFQLPFAVDTLQFDPNLCIISKGNSVVRLSAFDFSFNMYPNPAGSTLQVRVETSETRDVAMKITDELGQPVWSGEAQFHSGSNTTSLDIRQLRAGQYYLSFDIKGQIFTSPFVKVNR